MAAEPPPPPYDADPAAAGRVHAEASVAAFGTALYAAVLATRALLLAALRSVRSCFRAFVATRGRRLAIHTVCVLATFVLAARFFSSQHVINTVSTVQEEDGADCTPMNRFSTSMIHTNANHATYGIPVVYFRYSGRRVVLNQTTLQYRLDLDLGNQVGGADPLGVAEVHNWIRSTPAYAFKEGCTGIIGFPITCFESGLIRFSFWVELDTDNENLATVLPLQRAGKSNVFMPRPELKEYLPSILPLVAAQVRRDHAPFLCVREVTSYKPPLEVALLAAGASSFAYVLTVLIEGVFQWAFVHARVD